MTTSYSDMQVMITLATFAYVDMNPATPPMTVADYETAFIDAITSDTFLGDTSLATEGQWTVPWVGISESRSNLAYIAYNQTSDSYTVGLRGSVFSSNSPEVGPLNVWEDLAVWETKQLQVGPGNVINVSEGAYTAFEETTNAICTTPLAGAGLSGTNLVEALNELVGDGKPTIYVTGHSLGGATTTTIALYLYFVFQQLTFQVYSFAGPTAGIQDCAALYDQTFAGNAAGTNSSWRVYNVWDLVPNAWATLPGTEKWYPSPGPERSWWEYLAIVGATYLPDALPETSAYTQPSVNPYPINSADWESATRCQSTTSSGFLDEVLFQHYPNYSYMPLLGAPVPDLGANPGALAVPQLPGVLFTPKEMTDLGCSQVK